MMLKIQKTTDKLIITPSSSLLHLALKRKDLLFVTQCIIGWHLAVVQKKKGGGGGNADSHSEDKSQNSWQHIQYQLNSLLIAVPGETCRENINTVCMYIYKIVNWEQWLWTHFNDSIWLHALGAIVSRSAKELAPYSYSWQTDIVLIHQWKPCCKTALDG